MEKTELCSVIKRQFWPIRSFPCMLCCSDSELKLWMHVSSWITRCKINFCRVTSVSFKKFFRNLCAVLVLAFSTPSDRHLFVRWNAQNIVHVVFWASLLQEANTNLILFWTDLGQVENFLITPRISKVAKQMICISCFYWYANSFHVWVCMSLWHLTDTKHSSHKCIYNATIIRELFFFSYWYYVKNKSMHVMCNHKNNTKDVTAYIQIWIVLNTKGNSFSYILSWLQVHLQSPSKAFNW